MASNAFNADRRSILAAAPIMAVAMALPAIALAAPTDHFIAAVRKWEGARNDLNAHPYTRARLDDPNHAELAKQFQSALEAEVRAFKDLMNVRAPDHDAMIAKLDIIKADFEGGFDIECLIADIRHLAAKGN